MNESAGPSWRSGWASTLEGMKYDDVLRSGIVNDSAGERRFRSHMGKHFAKRRRLRRARHPIL